MQFDYLSTISKEGLLKGIGKDFAIAFLYIFYNEKIILQKSKLFKHPGNEISVKHFLSIFI